MSNKETPSTRKTETPMTKEELIERVSNFSQKYENLRDNNEEIPREAMAYQMMHEAPQRRRRRRLKSKSLNTDDFVSRDDEKKQMLNKRKSRRSIGKGKRSLFSSCSSHISTSKSKKRGKGLLAGLSEEKVLRVWNEEKRGSRRSIQSSPGKAKHRMVALNRKRICFAPCRYDVVRQAAKRLKMSVVNLEDEWDVLWSDNCLTPEGFKKLKFGQKVNSIPGIVEMCGKDWLTRNLSKMQQQYPRDYDFYPKSWFIPQQYRQVLEYGMKHPLATYILKPERGSQGRGIRLVKHADEMIRYGRVICQIYIERPFLIDGLKFDFRVYVLISSCEPLIVYVYNDGLARFATVKYKPPNFDNIRDTCMHLTNASVNKTNSNYDVSAKRGSKRKISVINLWFKQHGYNIVHIWRNIHNIIIKTIIAGLPMMKSHYRNCYRFNENCSPCFQILGFDILLDEKLKAHVLEMNCQPSFQTETLVDQEVKQKLLHDTFRLLNLDRYEDMETPEDVNRKHKHHHNFRRIYPDEHNAKLKEYFAISKRSWRDELSTIPVRSITSDHHNYCQTPSHQATISRRGGYCMVCGRPMAPAFIKRQSFMETAARIQKPKRACPVHSIRTLPSSLSRNTSPRRVGPSRSNVLATISGRISKSDIKSIKRRLRRKLKSIIQQEDAKATTRWEQKLCAVK